MFLSFFLSPACSEIIETLLYCLISFTAQYGAVMSLFLSLHVCWLPANANPRNTPTL